MQRKTGILIMLLGLIVLSACNSESDNTSEETEEALPMLEVEFELPEAAGVDEEIAMEAVVTYGDEKVKDADEVMFEFWEKGNEDDSTKIEAKNNKDGTYTARTTFDRDGVFEMYAHVTARDLHTMPKKSITVGEGASEENGHATVDDEQEQAHADGFAMHFMEPENIKVDADTGLMVHLQMEEENFEGADVQFEIWNDDVSDKHEWVEAEEVEPGEYTGAHTFAETGTYSIQIHVTDDNGLHEQEEHEVEVEK